MPKKRLDLTLATNWSSLGFAVLLLDVTDHEYLVFFAKVITAESFPDYFLDMRSKTPLSGSYPMQSPLPSMAPGILQFPAGTPPPGFTVPAMVY